MENYMGNEVVSFLQELRVKPLEDFHCLKMFSSGVEAMDNFIRGDFQWTLRRSRERAFGLSSKQQGRGDSTRLPPRLRKKTARIFGGMEKICYFCSIN